MEDTKTKLKPCPFCGGAPRLVTRDVEPQGDPWYGSKDETFVLCDCGCCLFDGAFHEGFYEAETRAVEAWNLRFMADGAKQERERCAQIAQHWTHPDTLRLHAGEMTAQELRTVVAVLNGVIAAIRAETPAHG